jgi:hypothetical protein
MIKHDAILKLASLKNDLEAAIASEIAKVNALSGKEYAKQAKLSLASGKRALARFRSNPPRTLPGGIYTKPGHPLYGYKKALQSVSSKQVRDILKAYAYPFNYSRLLGLKLLGSSNPIVTPSFLQSCIEAVEACEFGGIGEIRDEGRVFPDGWQEIMIIKTGDISSWIMQETKSHLVVKSDTLPPQELVLSNGKYTIDPPDERIAFNPKALKFHLACRHCEALGYDFTRESGGEVVFMGKVQR